jgi:hypothetical protein
MVTGKGKRHDLQSGSECSKLFIVYSVLLMEIVLMKGAMEEGHSPGLAIE